MNKHLSYLLGLLAVGGLIYLVSTGLFSIVVGYITLAFGVAAPLLLSYFVNRNILFPHWVILLWAGLMVATVGVIAVPELLHPVGYLICPEGYSTPEVAVKTTMLYEGATNTSATLSCRGESGLIESDSVKSLVVATLLYLLVCLPLLLISATVSKLRRREWGPINCFAVSIGLYGLLLAVAWLTPGLPEALRAVVQRFF